MLSPILSVFLFFSPLLLFLLEPYFLWLRSTPPPQLFFLLLACAANLSVLQIALPLVLRSLQLDWQDDERKFQIRVSDSIVAQNILKLHRSWHKIGKFGGGGSFCDGKCIETIVRNIQQDSKMFAMSFLTTGNILVMIETRIEDRMLGLSTK